METPSDRSSDENATA